MSLVAVGCGRGTRGVTTAALALAATWPQPALVAECDPAGGALAAWFELEPTPGMLSLAVAARHRLGPGAPGEHAQPLPIGLAALLGPPKAEQAEGLAGAWPLLGPVLVRADVDVLADCGRLGPRTPALPLLAHADLVVLLAEPTADGLVQLADRAAALAETVRQPPVVVLLGDRPYPPGELRDWLANERVDAEVAGMLPRDARAVGWLAGEPGRGSLRRTRLLRAAHALAEQLHARAATAPPAMPVPTAPAEAPS